MNRTLLARRAYNNAVDRVECPYCGTPDYLRTGCRSRSDTGACFDGTEPSPGEIEIEISRAAQARARERVEYEDPYGYERGRRY